MRRVEFPPKTHNRTKYLVSAICWATNRRGRNAWKSENVARSVAQYLHEQRLVNVNDARDRQAVGNALRWLADHGYAERRLDPFGRVTLEWRLSSDVDVTGMDPLPYAPSDWDHLLRGPRRRLTLDDVLELADANGAATDQVEAALFDHVDTETAPPLGTGIRDSLTTGPGVRVLDAPPSTDELPPSAAVQVPTVIAPPLPFPEPTGPPRLDELVDLLTAWHDHDPDAYATWVEQVVEQLSPIAQTTQEKMR